MSVRSFLPRKKNVIRGEENRERERERERERGGGGGGMGKGGSER